MHTPNTDDAVVFENVTKRYAQFALESLSFRLPKGEILGLVGPNGAGKSTCLQLLMGFIDADEGEIRVMGEAVPERSVALKQQVAFVSETMRLYAKADLAWHMAFLRELFPEWDDNYAKHLVNTFELKLHQAVKTFSLGQRVKSTLMLALARKPRLLVLDEPSTGLDPIARNELTEQLFKIILSEENSVIFSSQFTQDVERLSDSIAFLDDGRLINHQDKESYLERWRRVRVSGPTNFKPVREVIELHSNHSEHSFVHSDFSDATLAKLRSDGYQVEQVTPMTLEEIFIYQVRQHRQSRKEQQYA